MSKNLLILPTGGGHRGLPFSERGTNKKEAEQKAAFNALVELGVLEKNADESVE